MLVSRTIQLFLDSIGRREEYEFYLKKFHSDKAETCFAVIYADLASIEESGDLMTFDLQFLLRLDLNPMLLVTGPSAEQTKNSLLKNFPAFLFLVHDGHPLTAEKLVPAFEEARRQEKIPVLYAPNHELKSMVGDLIPKISRRMHILRINGALRTADEKLIQYFYLKKSNPADLQQQDQSYIDLAENCLKTDPSVHFSISSPINLLKEMFTVKGAGTIVRPGSRINHFDQVDEFDPEKLAGLMRESFNKPLREEDFLDRISDFYIEENYRGAAMLEKHPAGHYLSKFAVGTEARGEGLAQELWSSACMAQQSLFWRSRANNPINHWYGKHADGMQRTRKWNIFWRGIDAESIPDIIRYCNERKSDFLDAPH